MRHLLKTVLAGLAALCGPTRAASDAPRRTDGLVRRSIHQVESESHRGRAGAESSPESRSDRVPPLLPRPVALTHEVHGYHPYWMGSSYTSYDWSLLSTVAFFSLELNAVGQIVETHGWPWQGLVTQAHQNGVRVIVTATLFSSTDLEILLGNVTYRSTAITNLVNAVVAGNADGVNVDFEGVPGSRKQQLVAFMGELQAALGDVLPSHYLSIATPAVDWWNAFDYDALAAVCDHLMIMAYDYHWSGSATTGPVAPLEGWGAYNVAWTIADYVLWGAPRDKMLLGVPYYGYTWGSVSGDPGAATTGAGVARTYAATAGEVDSYEALWDLPSSTPWYRGLDPTWFQTWHEDASSLALKYDRVQAENLAGIGIWALGYDGVWPDLWGALDAAFHTPTSALPPAETLQPALGIAGANPARAHVEFRLRVGSAGKAELVLYDVCGRKIATLWRGTGPEAQAVWRGVDDAGRTAAAGTYYATLRTTDGKATRKFVWIR